MSRNILAVILIFLTEAICPVALAGETASERKAVSYFEQQLPEWSGEVSGETDRISSDLFRRCGLVQEVIKIVNVKKTRMPDGRVLLQASEHRFVWHVAVSPDNTQAWRVQGFIKSDLNELVGARKEYVPDDQTALRLLTTAFSGRRRFARLVLTQADLAEVSRELTSACGKKPPFDGVLNALPSSLPVDISQRGLVISSTCQDVFVEWWYFKDDSDGALVIERTEKVSSLSY